jgi:hypothetical protein
MFDRNAIGDRCRRDRKDPARTGRLNSARDQKEGERGREDREYAADGEDRNAERVDRATTDRVGELRHDRNADDVREEIERERPGDVARSDAVAVRDRGKRGRNDAEVERTGEHAEREREQQRKMRTIERVPGDARRRGGRGALHRRARLRFQRHRGLVTRSRDRVPSRRT